LKNDKFVPEAWWQMKYKGLQYSVLENRYYQPDRAIEDIPVPPRPTMVAEAQALQKSLTLKKISFQEKKPEEPKPETQNKSEEKPSSPKKSEEKPPSQKPHVSLTDLLHQED
jgi:hypothetical protein